MVPALNAPEYDSGYLGMAVQLYVQAHLGHYHIWTQKDYSKKTDSTAEIYTPFLSIIYMHNLNL